MKNPDGKQKLWLLLAWTQYNLLTQDSASTSGFRYRQRSMKEKNKLQTTAGNSDVGSGP
jgi:hypothetical protein